MSSIIMPLMKHNRQLSATWPVCVLGGYLAVKKVVDIGDIQSFIQYMRSFTQPIAQLASISNTIQSTGRGRAERGVRVPGRARGER